jgi:hypothetical protein
VAGWSPEIRSGGYTGAMQEGLSIQEPGGPPELEKAGHLGQGTWVSQVRGLRA